LIPEAPYLFSIAALNASLAGLAGLVAALRRETGMRPIDSFRLREIVEFAFANALLAVIVVPLSSLLGGTEAAARLGGGLAVVYVLATVVVLLGRQRRSEIAVFPRWWIAAAILDVTALGLAVASMLGASFAVYQLLLAVLLARPMVAFLLVLASFEEA
jgi:hypothetical protein